MTGISKMGRVTDTLLGAGSLGVLLIGLAALDDRVRDLLKQIASGEPIRHLAMASRQGKQVAHTVLETIGYQGTEDSSMIYMAVAGLVLVIFMLKT